MSDNNGQALILVVDDDRNLRKILQVNLELAGYRTHAVATAQEALAVSGDLSPDLIIVDLMLGAGIGGADLMRLLRAQEAARHTPAIVLSAKYEIEDKLDAFDAGANDYLTKPFSPQELLARVRTHLRAASFAELSPLTRLPGNRAVRAAVSSTIKSLNWSILYADIDNFKAYNDVYGVAHGDQAIQLLADILKDVSRRFDPHAFVGHIGGDDFIITCQPHADEKIAKHLIERFDRDVPFLYTEAHRDAGGILATARDGRESFFPTMSISVAVIRSTDCQAKSYEDIGKIAAVVKKKAKAVSGSSFVVSKDSIEPDASNYP